MLRHESRSSYRRRSVTALVVVGALAAALVSAGPASAAPPAPGAQRGGPPVAVDLVDGSATAETRSLFAYLQSVRGTGILFGHQHTTDYAVTDPAPAGLASDVRNGVGDFPAIFGWDSLILTGDERPGIQGASLEENAELLVDGIQKADALGGINTISAHFPNFAAGGRYNDTGGNAVRQILPGGPDNAAFLDYLDAFADVASKSVDESGRQIPIIFRPWHENNGGWFWWGAGHTTSAEYQEIFRYTVEYLRDTKGVHNFLYAYSPNGTFGGTDETYLKTYPGDDFVDILGYDLYDGTNGSQQWLDSLVADTAMISRLADEKGKISALTEFGMSGALKPNGQNPDLQWYTSILDALRSNPDSARIAYAQTWANFGLEQHYVPYPAFGTTPEHELMQDFRAFHADPASYFAGDLTNVFDRRTTPVKQQPSVHIVTPTDRQRVTGTTATIRVSATGVRKASATYTVDGGPAQPLALDEQGYYTGTYTIPDGNVEARTATVRATVTEGNGRGSKATFTDSALLLLGPAPVAVPGVVDTFEGYSGDDVTLDETYTSAGVNSIAHSTENRASGSYGLSYSYDFTSQSYTGIGRTVDQDWSGFTTLDAWMLPDDSGTGATLQVVADGIYFEYNVPLSGTAPLQLSAPFSEFAPASWDTAHAGAVLDAAKLAKVTQFSLYLGQGGAGVTSGTVYVDDIIAR
ncbi:glycosyl hydrolase [Arthrobacter sp. B1805]|uniref:glycosyl hydrolase n=1 Tax=Arthrobacter sp. B1805 TaxID=2058892 RepID=UPI000CE423B5|nr:glycosyl hydrolase [Arthrobacter sp. B1805]